MYMCGCGFLGEAMALLSEMVDTFKVEGPEVLSWNMFDSFCAVFSYCSMTHAIFFPQYFGQNLYLLYF